MHPYIVPTSRFRSTYRQYSPLVSQGVNLEGNKNMSHQGVPDHFVRGVAAAIAEFVRHGSNVVLAGDVLASLELELTDLECAEVDKHDLEELRRLDQRHRQRR